MSKVEIIADSISPTGCRFTTFKLKFSKTLVSELNTHRMLVRSVGSSRAIPTTKMIESIQRDPFIPKFTLNQKGMSGDLVSDSTLESLALKAWIQSLNDAVENAEILKELGIHKQNVNRVLEPYMQVELVLSGTEWTNFYKLRNHPAAQPDFQVIAAEMESLYELHQPNQLNFGDWHIPYYHHTDKELDLDTKVKVAIARCARLSYASHDGEFSAEKDLDLFARLNEEKHWSPLEHVAMCVDNSPPVPKIIDPKLHKFLFYDDTVNYFRWSRNYAGFYTYRHQVEDND